MSKSLIVYFSHNKENYFSGNIVNLEKGNVQVIAETLSTMIDADIYQIKEVDAYPFDYHECTKRASEELKNNTRPQILDPLESYDFTNKHIYPICSHEGSGMGRSESDLKKLCPNSIVHKGLSIHGSHVDGCRQQLERGLGGK